MSADITELLGEKEMTKVLIVDDNKEIRTVFKIMLSNYTVLEAGNGLEGIQMYEMHHPNIVLMDIQMPIMNGIEATKRIRKMDPTAKIIVITALPNTKNSEILATGVIKIFFKPVRKIVLLNTIANELTK